MSLKAPAPGSEMVLGAEPEVGLDLLTALARVWSCGNWSQLKSWSAGGNGRHIGIAPGVHLWNKYLVARKLTVIDYSRMLHLTTANHISR